MSRGLRHAQAAERNYKISEGERKKMGVKITINKPQVKIIEILALSPKGVVLNSIGSSWAPNVNQQIKNLEDQGIIEVQEDGMVTLTEDGWEVAVKLGFAQEVEI